MLFKKIIRHLPIILQVLNGTRKGAAMAVTMTDSEENIMGTMSEGRLLLKMALPMIFSVLVSSLYNQEISFCVRVQRACHVGLQFRRYDCCRAVRGNARRGGYGGHHAALRRARLRRNPCERGRLGDAKGRGDEEAANAFFTASVILMIVLASIFGCCSPCSTMPCSFFRRV